VKHCNEAVGGATMRLNEDILLVAEAVMLGISK